MTIKESQLRASRAYYKRNRKRCNIQTDLSCIRHKYPKSYKKNSTYKYLLKLLAKYPNKKCEKCNGRLYREKCPLCD